MMSAHENGFTSPNWATFKQIVELGGSVKKGSKGTAIGFYKVVEKKDPETGEIEKYFIQRFFTVFNLDQTEGLEDKFNTENEGAELSQDEKKIALENALLEYRNEHNIGYRIEAQDRAYYSPSNDEIVMPKNFHTVEGYCGTLAHEHIHSTGLKGRLNRFEAGVQPTEKDYAFEELVAEFGAAMLCAEHGIEGELEQHASYVASWLKALKGDSKYIFRAISAAQRAVDLVLPVEEIQEQEDEIEAA